MRVQATAQSAGPVCAAVAAVGLLALVAPAGAQDAGDGTPRAMAPIDLTGYWVSVVNEDWRWRMRTPPPGDFESIPLNDEGVRVGSKRYSLKDGVKFLNALSMEYDGKKFWATEVFEYDVLHRPVSTFVRRNLRICGLLVVVLPKGREKMLGQAPAARAPR